MKKRTLRAAAMMMTAAMCAGMLAGCGGGKAETAAPVRASPFPTNMVSL